MKKLRGVSGGVSWEKTIVSIFGVGERPRVSLSGTLLIPLAGGQESMPCNVSGIFRHGIITMMGLVDPRYHIWRDSVGDKFLHLRRMSVAVSLYRVFSFCVLYSSSLSNILRCSTCSLLCSCSVDFHTAHFSALVPLFHSSFLSDQKKLSPLVSRYLDL